MFIKSCRGETRMQKKHEKYMDVGSGKFSRDPMVVKEIISKLVSGALLQCEPTAFVSVLMEDVLSKIPYSEQESALILCCKLDKSWF